MKRIPRQKILADLRGKIASGHPILLAGAGCGLVAKAEEAAGTDLIMAYNTGIYRMDGHVSLIGYRYYSDGNGDTLGLARQLCRAVDHTPVVGGVCAEDPFRDPDGLLEQLLELGYSGITNVPSVAGASLKPGSVFGNTAAQRSWGVASELEMVKRAVKKDALTAMYAYAPEHVQPMLAAGVDIIGVHAGGTAGGTTGSLGEELLPLQRAIEMVNYCYDLAMKENPNAIVVVHGGPFEDPSAVKACYQATPAHGYIGASGVERIPVEKKLAQVYGEYRALHTAGKDQRP